MSASVLIVDADPLFAAHAQTALEAYGLTVHVRDDAPIDVLRKLKPTVLLVNVELAKSGASGFSICSRVRRDKDLKETPILLTSSESNMDAFKRHAATPDHADDYALKPLDGADLVGRVSKLLERVGQNGATSSAENGAAIDQDLTPPPQKAGPPPLNAGPPAINAGPPPLVPTVMGPPPLKKAPAPGPLTPPHGVEVPPRPAPSIPPASAEETWRAVSFDEMLRERLKAEAPPSTPANASADQKLTFLRQQSKYLETREKAARDGWEEAQAHGKDIERRLAAARIELARRDERIAELTAELEKVSLQLRAVETEFHTFQGEITRIFQEKDSEEKDTLARLAELEETNANLSKELEEAKKKAEDDQRRLAIFQEELDAFQQEQEELTTKLSRAAEKQAETEQTLRASERQVAELKMRLETTEAVSNQRYDELEQIRERIDHVAIEAANEKRHLEEQHEEELANVRADLEEANAELDRKLADAEKTRGEVSQELLKITAQRDALVRLKEQLQASLAEVEAKAAEREAQLKQEIAELHEERGGQVAVVDELTLAREELEIEVGRLRDYLGVAKAEIEQREHEIAELEQENADVAARAAELEQSLEETRNALQAQQEEAQHKATVHEAQLKDTEDELEELRNTLFQRMSELEKLKNDHQGADRRKRELEIAHKGAEERAKAGELRVEQLERQLEAERDEVELLSQKLVEAEAAKEAAEAAEQETNRALEEERTKGEQREGFIKKAKEKIVELQKKHEDSTAAARKDSEQLIERERKARQDLEDHLTEVESELTRREMEAAEATQRGLELERELQALRDQMKSAVDIREARILALSKELEQSRNTAGEARKSVDARDQQIRALGEQVRAREAAEQALQADVAARQQRIDQLMGDIADAEERLLSMSDAMRDQDRRSKLLLRVAKSLHLVREMLSEGRIMDLRPSMLPPGPEPRIPTFPPPPAMIPQAANKSGSMRAIGQPPPLPPKLATPPLPQQQTEPQLSDEDTADAGMLVPPGPPTRPSATPFSALVQEGKRGKKNAQRRKLKPLRAGEDVESQIDEAARLIDEGLVPVSGSTEALSPDPFRTSSALPLEQPPDDDRPEDDRQVTEVIRLEDLK